MLGIVLSVLKVIGFILLGIVAVILVALFLVLGVPVRYRGRIVCHDKLVATVQFSYLFHIVHVTVQYMWHKKTKTVRVFGIPVKRTGTGESKDDSEAPDAAPAVPEPADEDKPVVDETPADEDKPTVDEAPADEDKPIADEAPAEADKPIADEAPAGTDQQDTESKLEEPEQEPDEVSDKEGLVDTLEAMYNKYINERTLGMLGRIKKQLIRILRHILPRGPRGHLSFGFSDPAWTGYTLGILGRLYRRVRRLKIEPDFEARCFDCDIWMHGHVRLGTVVLFLLLLVPNRDFRYVYRNIIKNKQ